ncbi:CHAD domain-containing protein [Ktedonospora formicarum]|uniref:Exopolyphosphatase n=1 Tax=Ktedonospora formicarum TaxID=2778364 RepID=A0A8J3HWG0_9CHLR|nr:CHAD domain-containing protein [Ktedonospora formicarum]GHO43276.1 hypothetical protein KSX_14390 [Ktedonospora formicarum]
MSLQENAPTWAAIDIGSNTLQLVIARCQADDLDILIDAEDVVRLGQDVNAHGEITPAKRGEVVDILKRYRSQVSEHHAEAVFVVATEAVRKASNAPEFLDAVERAIGAKVQVVAGEIEALLTFFGASYEYLREQHTSPALAVMDLGGGSTELVTATGEQVNWLTSLPIGSGWLHDRYTRSDPPTEEERELSSIFLKTYLKGVRIKGKPKTLIATGGSAKTLMSLARASLGLDAQASCLSYMDVVRCDGILEALCADEITQRYGISEKRAGLLPSGVQIIKMLMLRLQMCELWISTHGIREGLLLAYARYGERWLEVLETQVQSLGRKRTRVSVGAEMLTETFMDTGRRLLSEGANRMSEWRDEVLKNEDIEAVHKMRVASRRLRAILDSYEGICDPKLFKKVYRLTKEMADMLGKARDTDVMILNLNATLEEVVSEQKAGIAWLLERLHVYRVEHQATLERYLNAFDERKFQHLIDTCIPKGGRHNGKG